MSHLVPWLTDHVAHAAETCGAVSASVYVPTPWNPDAPGILVHVGEGRPLPEMTSVAEARAFASREAARLGAAPGGMAAAPVGSEVPEGCYLPIPLLATLWHRASLDAAGPTGEAGQHRRLADRSGAPPIIGWLGLRFAGPTDRARPPVEWQSVLELASALASTYVSFHGMLTDPVTGLPGRAELNGTLRAELERAHTNGLPFSLVFVRPANLDEVNQQLGRRAGDAVLREFLEVLHGSIRRSDTIMRFGGSVFALPLRDVSSGGARIVAGKIQRRMAERRFLQGTLAVPCAVGIASVDGHEAAPLQPLDLLGRADQALAAAGQHGHEPVVLWRADGDVAASDHLDPLLGVFTGQTEKDYRNMRLLWDVLQALSGATGSELARAVVGRLGAIFTAARTALLEQTADGGLRLVAGQQRAADSGAITSLSGDDLLPVEWQANAQAVATREPRQESIDVPGIAPGAAPPTAVCVPLVIDGRTLGSLYMIGRADALRIDASDFPVLGSVAAQLALAFDREQLAEQQRSREHRERQLLKAELGRLRTALKQAQFVFQSRPMTDLLNTARRVSSTDATVLITGESGTGKEMLAQTVHELSARRAKPLVVVDCGAIPASLMDSELFGRERGAYTGADRRTGGRLVQADGGTVFLDEIGELPLEVQAKLLRFVQEKTVTMVGSTHAQRVDVRIVAATNRSLEDEVRAGRFREDLFHRLNVVRLRVPPLRERPDDVLLLARHFLETFARQYGASVRGLTADAEQRLLAYDWPGNVRELQNTILQAVVLADGDLVRADGLQLTRSRPARSATTAVDAGAGLVLAAPRPAADAPSGDNESPDYDEVCRALAVSVAAEIDAALEGGGRLGPPLGKWLARDLVLVAFEAAGGVAARAAALLALPETTFSRRLRRAQADAGTTREPESWATVRHGLEALVRASGRPPGNLLEQVEEVLLGLVLDRVRGDLACAAGLMGVSVPTMKRRLGQAQSGRPAPTTALT